MVRRLMRHLAALVTAVAVLAGGLSAPPAVDAAPAFVTVVVNHDTKTITFKAQLVIYAACDQPRCAVSQDLADSIKKSIEATWNKGNKIRCYTVKVDVKVTPGPPPSATDNRVGIAIRLDPSAQAEKNDVSTERTDNRWQSDKPSDRVVPVNDPDRPSTWSKSPSRPGTRAHEFGHILGLDDTYTVDEKGVPHDIPGSPHDLMNTGMFENDHIAQETLDRLGKRNGVDPSQLRCGWVYLDATPAGALEGQKCDGIAGTWTIAGLGSLAGISTSTTYSITIVSERAMQGTYTLKEVSKPGQGVTSTMDEEGTASLRIDDAGKAIFDLRPTKATIRTKVAGYTQKMQVQGQPEQLTWEPAKKECDGA